MTSRTNILVQLVCILAVMATVHSKPKVKPASHYFDLCSRRDQKELNECVRTSIMKAKTKLKDGIPALGLIPIEPLVIPRLEMTEGSGSFKALATMTNLTTVGLSAYTVTDTNFVLDDKTLDFNITLMAPYLNMTADYKMDGRLLVISLSGEGNCEINLTDVVAVSRTKGRVVERDGDKFIELTSVKWDVSVNHNTTHGWFYNLFNGDKRLGDATNNVINSNGAEFFSFGKHLPEEAFGQVFKDLASRVVSLFPIKDLFLD